MTIDDLTQNSEKVASILKALAHPGRLLICCQLMEDKKSVGEISQICDLSQSHTSQYLNQLALQGILKKEKEGKQVFYELGNQEIKKLIQSLYEIYCKGDV